MRAALGSILRLELRAGARRPFDALCGLLFFAVAASLFPLALGPDAPLLAAIGPGVMWVAALLAVLVSLHRLFEPGLAQGALAQLLLSPLPLPLLVVVKAGAHWVLACLPVVLAAPLLALQFGLPAHAVTVLAFSLLLGTPTLVLLGALGAALTLGLRGSVLLAVIVLPLCVPVLVFGSGAVVACQQGLPPQPHLFLLGACLSLALVLCPWATGAALRLALE